MNTYRPRLFYVALVAVAICNLGSVCTIGQNPSTSTAAAKSCVGLHCAFVRIVHVTSYGKNGDLKYIIASEKLERTSSPASHSSAKCQSREKNTNIPNSRLRSPATIDMPS
jgi:hypothetical protein